MQQAGGLVQETGVRGHGLAGIVQAEDGQGRRLEAQVRGAMAEQEAPPEAQVHHVAQGRIHSAQFPHHVHTVPGGRLVDHRIAPELVRIVRIVQPVEHAVTMRIPVHHLPAEHLQGRVRRKGLQHPGHRARRQGIVTVHPGEHVAGGVRQPLVDGVALAFVLLTAPPRQTLRMPFDHLAGTVGAATIHHDVLHRHTLVRHGTQAFLQVVHLLVAGRDDGGAERAHRRAESTDRYTASTSSA